MTNRFLRFLAAALLLPAFALAGLVNQSGPRYFASSGPPPSDEVVGTYADLDIYNQRIYRVITATGAGNTPTWTSEGGTVTVLPTGAWDGGPAFKITPPVVGAPPNTGEGNVGVGGYAFPDDLAITKLNVRFEVSFGPDWITQIVQMDKWVIVISSDSPSGEPGQERPMYYLSDMDTQAGDAPAPLRLSTLQAVGVACGTVKNFEPVPPNAGYNWPRGNEDFYWGPTNTTISSKPIRAQGEWYTVELEMISTATVDEPDGLIRMIVWNRAGTQLTDLSIPWNWDNSWTPNKYITDLQVIGGYQNSVSSPSADNYQLITGVTFAANRAGLIGMRAEFIQ